MTVDIMSSADMPGTLKEAVVTSIPVQVITPEKQNSTLSSFAPPEAKETTPSLLNGELKGTSRASSLYSSAPDAVDHPHQPVASKTQADLPRAEIPRAEPRSYTVRNIPDVPDLDLGPMNELRPTSAFSFAEERRGSASTAAKGSEGYGADYGMAVGPHDESTPRAVARDEPLDDATIARLAGDIELKAEKLPTGDTDSPEEEEESVEEPYMPMVLPTQTYAPRAPSISVKHSSKPSSSAASGMSRFNPGSRRSTLITSRTTPSSPRKTRSPSVASSASSVCSNHSAIIEIPEPGTRASVKSKHSRNPSDPRYMRFLSAVGENQKKSDPQRYIGYPGLASHMTETQSLVFRRFDEVHVRMLLYLQDQIAQLEARLLKVDEQNEAVNGIHNGTFRHDPDPYRLEIMESLRVLLGEYDIMILTFSKMQEVKASDRTVTRLKDWLKRYSTGSPVLPRFSTGGPIAKNELEWLEKTNDLSNLAVGPGPISTSRPVSTAASRKGSVSAAKANSFMAAARAGSISTTARIGSIAAVREASVSAERADSISGSRAGSISAISPTSTGPLAETWTIDSRNVGDIQALRKQSTFSRLLHSRKRKEN